jgi:hypothetical protein
MKASLPPIPFDQHCLVALKFLFVMSSKPFSIVQIDFVSGSVKNGRDDFVFQQSEKREDIGVFTAQ